MSGDAVVVLLSCVIQELFCVGTDLSQKVLNRLEEGFTEEAGSIHLMSAACRGTVTSLIRFFWTANCILHTAAELKYETGCLPV